MKKLTLSLMLIIMLISSLSFACSYKLDSIITIIKDQGKVGVLDSDNLIMFLENHSGEKDKNHTSYYISILYSRMIEDIFVPISLAFIKENWKLENDIWTVYKYIAKDNDLNDNTDQFYCEKLVEKVDGLVISLDRITCTVIEKELIDEIILKTGRKLGI